MSTFEHSDRRSRRASEFLGSDPSPRGPTQTLGQDCSYAETWHNPLPEIVSSSQGNTAGQEAAPAARRSSIGTIEGTAPGRTVDHDSPSIRPDTAGSKERVMNGVVWVEPTEEPWYKTISKKKWLAIVLVTVGITGVVVAILGAMNKFSGGRLAESAAAIEAPSPNEATADQGSTSSTSETSGNDNSTQTSHPSPSSTTSSAHPKATGTHPKITCSDPSTFVTSAAWVGTEVGTYSSEFAQAASAASCCESCLGDSRGCAGWLYIDTSTFTPCTKIVLTVDQPGGADDACPKGYAPVTYFARGDKEKAGDAVAGMGPCSGKAQVQ